MSQHMLGTYEIWATICRLVLTIINNAICYTSYKYDNFRGDGPSHGQSSYWTAKSSFFFLTSEQHGAENLRPKLHHGVDCLDHDFGILQQSQNRARF